MGFEALKGNHQQRAAVDEIRVVIFNVMSSDGEHELRLVEYEDGLFAIQRDGRAICHERWTDGELENCIQLFRHISHGGGMVDELMPGAEAKGTRKHRTN